MLYIYDTNIILKGVIDNYENITFTKTFKGNYGKIKIVCAQSAKVRELLQINNICEVDNTAYIINSVIYENNKIEISGKELKSILDNRVIQTEFNYNGTIEDLISKVLNENFIAPTDTKRKIDNFVIKDLPQTNISIDKQINYINIGRLIDDILSNVNYGYTLSIDRSNKTINFSLLELINSNVILSKNRNTLLEENIMFSNNNSANSVVLIDKDKNKYISSGTNEGILLKEMVYTDSALVKDSLTDTEYNLLLSQRANEILENNKEIVNVDALVNVSNLKEFDVGYNFKFVNNDFSLTLENYIAEIETVKEKGFTTYFLTFGKQI